MHKFLQFVSGFMIGSAAGAAVALLVTPASGEDLRHQTEDRYQRIQNDVRQAADARRTELEQQLKTLRAPRKAD